MVAISNRRQTIEKFGGISLVLIIGEPVEARLQDLGSHWRRHVPAGGSAKRGQAGFDSHFAPANRPMGVAPGSPNATPASTNRP